MSRRKYKSDRMVNIRPPVVDDPPSPHVEVPPAMPVNHDTPGADPDEARTALASRVAEMSAAEQRQREHAQHQAAMIAAAQAQPQQQRAAAVPPQLQQWIDEHPQAMADPHTRRKLDLVHQLALLDGLEVGGADYLARLEHAIGHHAPAPVHEPEPAPPPHTNGGAASMANPHFPPPRGPTYSAPVSRTGTGVGGGPVSPSRRTYSAEQVEAAKLSGIPLSEYGRQLDRFEAAKKRGDYPGGR